MLYSSSNTTVTTLIQHILGSGLVTRSVTVSLDLHEPYGWLWMCGWSAAHRLCWLCSPYESFCMSHCMPADDYFYQVRCYAPRIHIYCHRLFLDQMYVLHLAYLPTYLHSPCILQYTSILFSQCKWLIPVLWHEKLKLGTCRLNARKTIGGNHEHGLSLSLTDLRSHTPSRSHSCAAAMMKTKVSDHSGQKTLMPVWSDDRNN